MFIEYNCDDLQIPAIYPYLIMIQLQTEIYVKIWILCTAVFKLGSQNLII